MAKCIKAFILSNGPAVVYFNIKKKNLQSFDKLC